MKTLWNSLALSLLACTLPACEDAPAPAPVAAAPAARPAPAAPAAAPAVVPAVATTELQVQPAYTYTYSPVGRRDPFFDPFKSDDVTPPPPGCTGSLCQWDLEQLKVVAIITGDSSPMAMVEDPLGRGFILRRDTPVGRQGGRVTQIRRDSITVTQYVPGPKGNIAVPVEMKIEQGARAAAPHDLLSDKPYEL